MKLVASGSNLAQTSLKCSLKCVFMNLFSRSVASLNVCKIIAMKRRRKMVDTINVYEKKYIREEVQLPHPIGISIISQLFKQRTYNYYRHIIDMQVHVCINMQGQDRGRGTPSGWATSLPQLCVSVLEMRCLNSENSHAHSSHCSV